jgi:Fe-S cluster biosynthesis and repair protein YggX
MLKKIERKMEGEKLFEAQKTFFILGFSHDFMGDPKFPFESQQKRRDLWNKYKTYIQKQMYAFRKHGNFRNPNWNCLRAEEYWKFDSPEPRLILNGAKRIHPEDPDSDIWDRWPSEETQFEYLSRLNLLTDVDRQFIEKYNKDFWREEKEEIDYRKFEKEETEKELLLPIPNVDGNGGIEISNLSRG